MPASEDKPDFTVQLCQQAKTSRTLLYSYASKRRQAERYRTAMPASEDKPNVTVQLCQQLKTSRTLLYSYASKRRQAERYCTAMPASEDKPNVVCIRCISTLCRPTSPTTHRSCEHPRETDNETNMWIQLCRRNCARVQI